MNSFYKSFVSIIFVFISLSSSRAQADTLRVFILAGQSNMMGWGYMYDESVLGSLEHTITNNSGGIYDKLQDEDGDFVTRDDVWIDVSNEGQAIIREQLTVGQGGNAEHIGPECGFGFTMGDYLEEDILIIKKAWGGKSLGVDFRPPSSSGPTGAYYELMIDGIITALEDVYINYPQLDEHVLKIEGFGWHQGWNDGDNAELWEEYEENMINLIQDVREDLQEPTLPIVIANTGMGGFSTDYPDTWIQNLQNFIVPAQSAAVASFGVEGHVGLADTRPFWVDIENSPSAAIHHWNDNAYTYLNIGEEMAFQMIELLQNQTTVKTNNDRFSSIVSICPNPSHDVISISELADLASVVITDIRGATVISIDSSFRTLDVSILSAGMYFLTFIDSKGVKLETLKFVKE